jgi:hypothetical protein
MKVLEIKIKQVYGKDTYYPANAEAEIFAKLARTTTLLPETLKLAKQLGYEIQVNSPAFSI